MNTPETQAMISQLFANLNIGKRCIDNPSSCTVTYHIAHNDNSGKCVTENCTSLSVEQINLVDLLNAFADINSAKYVTMNDFDALRIKNNDVFSQIATEFMVLKEYSLAQTSIMNEIIECISSFQPLDKSKISNALKYNFDALDYNQFSNNQFLEKKIEIANDEPEIIHDNNMNIIPEEIVYNKVIPEEIITSHSITPENLAVVGIFSDDILLAIKQLFEEARILPENLQTFSPSLSLENIIVPKSSGEKNIIYEINKGNFLEKSDVFLPENDNAYDAQDEQVQSVNLDMGTFKNFLVEIGVSVTSI